jgi:hypothetical protein
MMSDMVTGVVGGWLSGWAILFCIYELMTWARELKQQQYGKSAPPDGTTVMGVVGRSADGKVWVEVSSSAIRQAAEKESSRICKNKKCLRRKQ